MRVHLRRRSGRARLVPLALAGVLALAACGDSGDDGGGGGGGGESGGDLVFGAASDPVTLDAAYVSDGESLRVIRQIFEGLVTTEEGGTEVVPALAKEWENSEDGLEWTFTLEEDVTFHDGEPFNAEAVCFNFDRWYNFTGLQQSASVSYYWQTVMGGYANNESPDLSESLYESCEATDDTTATITLTSPSASFLTGLTLPSFSIASPKALEEFGADEVSGTEEEPQFTGTFGTEQPIGTGPFQFEEWDPGNRLTLVRYEDYWGEPAQLDRLIFRPIAEGSARAQALEGGDIQAYDGVDPADVSRLESAGFNVLERPAFNVGYIGFNTALPPLDNLKIRQAIAHAINREALVQANYPEGSEVATQFMPPDLFGWADDVPTYEYDVDKAKQLIAESGVSNPTLEFWYPTDVTRPYMPDPAANFQAMSADLTAAGFTVTPKSAPWNPDYLAQVDAGKTQLRLLGWNGDFADPDNFVGTFFRTKQPAWGPLDESIYADLEAARLEPDQDARAEMYKAANKKIMEFLPGLPYVHNKSFLVTAEGVEGLEPSPVSNEIFQNVTVS
ncbi:MAG: ABC transporter substrate-binding protein [Actinomycetes bacterium]